MFLHVFCENNSTLGMAYLPIYNQLHFHFDIGNLMVKILPLLLGTGTWWLDVAMDQNDSVLIDCSVAEYVILNVKWRKKF